MIAVIDYGMGNLKSVSKALEAVGAEVEITNNPKHLTLAGAIVLPGVGAFLRGMENLKRLGILPSILKAIQDGKPFLGICLGLQLLFTESEEHGIHYGLDIVKGRVKRFNSAMKIPHMGWNQIKIKNPSLADRQEKSKFKIFNGIPDNAYFYFVHSYYVDPEDESLIVATTEYGIEFASAIQKDNVWAVQFHPERSGNSGLKILKNFAKISSGNCYLVSNRA